ncbi:MAG: P-II family nitrogen regulator [Methanomicrobium sp.]|nr:P-II family nitrogen regulator [Methanomicrobium sp.]MDD4300289.1 P-II family nitrogen regulator [Methanomicrobium sp.]
MKMIEAIIRPEKLEKVSDALMEKGFHAMTVSDVRGRGAQRGIALQFRGKEILVNLIPKVKIEIAVPKEACEEVIEIIRQNAYTGKNGDGKLFLYDIEKIIEVRTR